MWCILSYNIDIKTFVKSLNHVWLFATPCTAAHQGSLSFTISQNLLKFMSIESMMSSNHLVFSCPLLLPSIFPRIRVFSNESALCIRWPKFGASTSASVLPMNIQDLFPLGLTGWISLQSKDSQESSPHHSPQKHQFLCAQPSLRSNSHIHTWLLEKPYLWLNGPMFAK